MTSGAFGNQPCAPLLNQPASEATKNRFEASVRIGTTSDNAQIGQHISVSPDSGNGGRMSYLRFEDQIDGVHVFFDDVTDAGPLGTVADFPESDIAILSRATSHRVQFVMDFVSGPANDVGEVFIDKKLVKTGPT